MRLAFQPLFFLPRPALRWAYDQAYFEQLMDTPFLVFFITIDRGGIWFPYKGDEVLWTWPWRRKGLAPFISVGFSGTGEWGDARFWSLKELDDQWDAYFNAEEIYARFQRNILESMKNSSTDVAEFMAAEDVQVGDLVAIDENNQVRKIT